MPARPVVFHGKTWGRIHFRNPALRTYPIIASPQRSLETVGGVERTSATEEDGEEGVGSVMGDMATATVEATTDKMARAARRGDKAKSGKVSLFLG